MNSYFSIAPDHRCQHKVASTWCVLCRPKHVDAKLRCGECHRLFSRFLLIPIDCGGPDERTRFLCAVCAGRNFPLSLYGVTLN
jgi:hypothetical protein